MLLGSERVVTQDYATHKDAEDYAGVHLSDIKIDGTAKVIRVVNKYIPHEDSINHDDYVKNKNKWKDGVYYNCVSVTGKVVRYYQSELGGNQVELECYEGTNKRYFRILHMATVLVKVGDIIDSNTLIGKQGNTGLVLSHKSRSDITYGSHVHFEVRDTNYNSMNPREYALFDIRVNYEEQTNPIDNTKEQIKIIADKINIREFSSVTSKDIGDVYNGEIYTVLSTAEDDIYTWYQIKTSLGITGYVANEKGKSWVSVSNADQPVEDSPAPPDGEVEPALIFECKKEGVYAIKLNLGEKLYIK